MSPGTDLVPTKERHGPLAGVKALTQMVFNRFTGWGSGLGLNAVGGIIGLRRRSLRDIERTVGDGLASSVVVPCVMWLVRTFPEAPVQVLGQDGIPVQRHDLVRLIRRPNEFYSGAVMWMATITNWLTLGETYWIKIRNGAGVPVELWWAPSWLLTPVSDDPHVFITHYEYRPGGTAGFIRLENDDVVHFRNGLDPDNPRRGWSPLKAVLREVYTDDEAAAFTAALLHNMGVPGLVISPTGDSPPSPEDVAATKDYVAEEFTGDRRGKPLVLSGPTSVVPFGFSPEQLNLAALRRVPEERVSGALGVPAILAGLGAGLERSTFANYAEARAAGWEDGVIPMQRLFGEDLWHQLLPDIDPQAQDREVGWDRSQVRALQEDRLQEAQRAVELFRGSVITRKAAKIAVGDEPGPEDNCYAVPIAITLVPDTEIPGEEPDPPPPSPGLLPPPVLPPDPAPDDPPPAPPDPDDAPA